jgi:hypothetical protein
MLLLFLLFLFSPAAYADVQEDDFAARCGAAGVVYCAGLDSATANVIDGLTVIPDGESVYRYAIDANVRTSGAGALRFDLPPPPHTGANIAGSLQSTAEGQGTGGNTFKHNQTFYYQYRFRLSKFLLDNSYGANFSWKVGYFYRYPVPCGALGLVIVNWYNTGLLTGYTNCGQKAFVTDETTGLWEPPDSSQYIQQGDYPCRYAFSATDPCFRMLPNLWYTVYAQIDIGDWGVSTRVRYYIATEKDPVYKKFIDVDGLPMDCNNPPGCLSDTEGYQAVTLDGGYMTNLATTAGYPYPAHIWYDELIVSTSPIAAPAVMVPASNHVIAQRTSGGSFVGGGIRR